MATTPKYEFTYSCVDGSRKWTMTGKGITAEEAHDNALNLIQNVRITGLNPTDSTIDSQTIYTDIPDFGNFHDDVAGFGTVRYILTLKADATKRKVISVQHFAFKFRNSDKTVNTEHEEYNDIISSMTDGKGNMLTDLYDVESASFTR